MRNAQRVRRRASRARAGAGPRTRGCRAGPPRLHLLAAAFLSAAGVGRARADGPPPAGPVPGAEQAAQYRAEVSKTIVELQPLRRSDSVAAGSPGGRPGKVALLDLNPAINAWFLLSLDLGRGERATYHLENPRPRDQTLALAEGLPGLRLSSPEGDKACDLWAPGANALEKARRSGLPYAPICGGRLYLRNHVGASATELERVTDFLRDHVWAGDRIISFVKKEFFVDRYLERGVPGAPAFVAGEPSPNDGPLPAAVSSAYADRRVIPKDLGIELEGAARVVTLGRWYRVAGIPGVDVSAIEPQDIAEDLLKTYPGAVSRLDPVESGALAYLVSFDLGEFDLGFSLGTEHPRVGWSERVSGKARDRNLPGPDGIDRVEPVVTTGMISPALAPRVVAAFTAGFKRQHGAFARGPLASQNHGSHYGFIEQGTVFSKLEPGLATLYVLDDGSVNMKTWTRDDDALLPRIRHARQNGVPLIEFDPATGQSRPGALVNQWSAGNWSGSAGEDLRTLRAGACLQETASRRFLVYGYFSGATPSAMARVFQAFGCRYAMHLDMNALEHTYLALYMRKDGQVGVQHLIEGMAVVDKSSRGRLLPRFLGAPDDRDFFYLYRREQPR